MAGKGVPKLGSVEVTIGGKTHSAEEFHTTPHTPPISTGKVSTASAIKTAAESRVHASTEQLDTGIKHNAEKTSITSEVKKAPQQVEGIKTAAQTPQTTTTESAYKPNVHGTAGRGSVATAVSPTPRTTSPGSVPTSPLTGRAATGNVQTGSGVSTAAETRVQSSTENFFGTDAQVGGKSTITSEIQRTPRTVEAVKTTMTGKVSQTTPQQVSAPITTPSRTGGTARTGSETPTPGFSSLSPTPRTASPGSVPTSPLTGRAATGNVQTGSGVSTAAETRVQSSTENFFGTDAQVGGKSTITSEIQRTPRTVEAVKTTMTGKVSQTTPQQVSAPGAKPIGRGSASEDGRGEGQGATYTFSPYPTGRLSVNAVTGSMLTTAQRLRTANQMGSGYKVGHLSTSGMNISGEVARNALARMSGMMIGYGTAATVSERLNGAAAEVFNIPEMFAGEVNAGNTGAVFAGYSNGIGERELQDIISKSMNGDGTVNQNVLTELLRHKGINATPEMIAELTQGGGKSFFDRFLQNPTGLKDSLLGTAKTGLFSLQSRMEQAPDLGTESIGQAISLGQTAYMSFRLSQKATEIAPEAGKQIFKIGSTAAKATYQVATTTGKATVTLAKSTAAIARGYDKTGKVVINVPKDLFAVLKRYSFQTGLNKTAIAQTIVHRVQAIKTGFYAAKGRIQTGYAFSKNAVKGIIHKTDKAVKVVHGIATGTVSMAIVRRGTARQVRTALRGVRTRVKTGIATNARLLKRGIIRGGGIVVKNVPKGMFNVYKAGKFGIKNVSLFGAGILTGTDDFALQGVGHAINATHLGVKTSIQAGKLAGKAGGYSVKTAVKAGRGARAGYAFIKNNGLKAAFQNARKKIGQKIFEAGKSLVSAAINLVKTVGMKIALPLILIVVVVGGFTAAISTPVSAVGAILGGIFNFDGEGDDVEVVDYLSDPTIGVPALMPPLKDDIKDEIKTALEDTTNNDIIRFKSDLTGADTFLNVSKDASGNLVITNFDTAFPTDDQVISMLQPLFNAVVLMNYDLAPSEAQAKDLMEYMFSKVFKLENKDTVEYCGQNLLTGEGDPDDPCTECGEIHAHTDCPNPITGTHSSYTCSSCCYLYCDGGHDCGGCIENIDGTYSCPGHNYDDDCCHACNGYSYCDEHKVKTFTLAIDGIYTLIDEYFQEPINTLSAIPEASRTQDQKEQLQSLKDYLEIFWEMVNQYSENSGLNMSGNLSVTALASVTFDHGTRRGCQEVVDTALGQVGLSGGRPFWQYYGFDERVEWCACFVHWCMRHTPYTMSRYPTTSNNAGCVAVSSWFKDNGQWANGGYTDLVAGDVIFFDWEPDGTTDHIGIVIGRSGSTVYTVEGNSGDAVRINTYDVNSNVIYGYGLMNYEP